MIRRHRPVVHIPAAVLHLLPLLMTARERTPHRLPASSPQASARNSGFHRRLPRCWSIIRLPRIIRSRHSKALPWSGQDSPGNHPVPSVRGGCAATSLPAPPRERWAPTRSPSWPPVADDAVKVHALFLNMLFGGRLRKPHAAPGSSPTRAEPTVVSALAAMLQRPAYPIRRGVEFPSSPPAFAAPQESLQRGKSQRCGTGTSASSGRAPESVFTAMPGPWCPPLARRAGLSTLQGPRPPDTEVAEGTPPFDQEELPMQEQSTLPAIWTLEPRPIWYD